MCDPGLLSAHNRPSFRGAQPDCLSGVVADVSLSSRSRIPLNLLALAVSDDAAGDVENAAGFVVWCCELLGDRLFRAAEPN